ncbi:MAG: BACON domain-containing protein, partial [Bacteroidales bacterium]|nr:BACON domain-containing protein [Bacteroidales bacterium]
MKSRTIFLSLLALAAAFTGCRQEEADIVLPGIQVTGSDLSFDAETKKASYAASTELTTLNLSVTANRDWTAEINWDSDEVPWIAVTPDHGEASDNPQRVTVTILNNAGYNRNKQVKFSINYDYKTLAIDQVGERGEEIIGTLDNPLTVAGAIKYVKSLGADVQSSSGVYVKGKISRIDDGSNFAASGTYGNATFYISDDGSDTSDQFYCYRVLYLGNKKWTSKDPDIKVGDDVIIYGHVVNYKGNTPETVQGTAFIYEHNGVNRGTDEGGGGNEGTPAGTGTQADPYNVAAARAAVKDLTWTSNDNYEKTGVVYVKGKISRIADNGTYGQSGTFGNATFYINDDGADGAELYAYRILYLGNKKYTSGTDIKVGDEVVICGELMNYRGNTPETVANAAYLYSLNGEGGGGGGDTPGGGGDPAGTGTQADPYNVAAARNAVKDFTWTSNDVYDKTGTVYVKGKISRIADNGTYGQSGTYGNATFYISDDGKESNELYCYRLLYLGNVKYTSGTDIKVGDEVIICGELMNYRGNTPETVANAAYLYSLNSSGGGGGGGDTPGGASGTGTLSDPYNPLGAINAVKGLTWTSNDVYDKTDKVYVKGKISRIANNGTYVGGGTYGNASYWISADGTEKDEFQIYRSLYFNGEKYTEGTDIQVGDEVIVYGALMNYRGNTPETVANESWL